MIRSTFVLAVWLLASMSVEAQGTLSQGRADVFFQSGLDKIQHRQFGAAISDFENYLLTRLPGDPRKSDAEYFRAFCAATLLHSDGEKLLGQFVTDHAGHPRAMHAYFDLATFFYDEMSYSKAAHYFTKVNFNALSEDQRNVGRFRWGYSLFSQRNLLGALDQFNTVKALGGQYGPASSYYAGFIELSVGDFDNARIDFQRAEKSPSYATIVPPLIATTYLRQGNDNELIAYAEPLLDREDFPTDELSLLTAEAWYRKGDYARALARYESYIDEHDNVSRSVYTRAGNAAWLSSNETVALNYLKRAASDADSVGMYASYLLGTVYLKRQEKPLALTAFETSKQFKKNPPLAEESLFLSAKINYDLGRSDLAIREFESVMEIYPQSVHTQEIKELLAQAYVNANNYNKAIEYIESLPTRTMAVDRAYQKATYLKGTEYFNKEEYPQAASALQKSLEFPLDSRLVADASFWLGETFAVGRRYDEAIPHYERAIGQPGLSNTMIIAIRYGLGYAQFNMQRYDKALTSFKDFVMRGTGDPNYADGLLRLADCQYVLKSYAEALASYRKVIQLKSVDTEYAHLQSGVILAIQHQYPEAKSELGLVARNGSSRYREEALYQLGQIELELGNYPLAVGQFTTLISTAKTTRYVPYAYSRRAAANFNLKNYSQTADDYIAVVEKFPGHPVVQDVLLPLQEALRLSNRIDEFDKHLAQFKQANPDNKGIETVEFESAKSYYFNQQYPKAAESLSAFIRNYPESPQVTEARYYEAEAYYRLKDFSTSLGLHQEVSKDIAFPLMSKAVSRVGELEFKLQHYDLAVVAFKRLAVVATNKKDEHTAYNGLMESYFLLAQYDSAERYARTIQGLGGVNANAQSKASLFLGKSAMARGDYDTAKDEFLATINGAQDESSAEAKYLMAEIFYLSGEHTMCYETLISLNRDFAAYEDWVGKSFLLLADNYVATDELFQSKGTLRSLIENFPRQEVRDLASERLKAIELNERKKEAEAIKRDTTERKE